MYEDTAMGATRKTQVVFPEDLLEEVDRVVGSRKRSEFVVEATREKLHRLRFAKALRRAAGSWSDENHPDLKTQADINRYLRKVRASTNRRLARRVRG
jgi:Arc/MetJ-type ribon-helix-helix transcriptional regulator